MNPQEFANKIRTKYPGAYDNVPDEELTQKVIAKYPVYANQVQMKQAQATQDSPGLFSMNTLKGETSYKADTGGGIVSNTAKTIGNIPSSAIKLAKAVVVDPVVNTVKATGAVANSISEKGVVSTAQDVAKGFNTLVDETAGKVYEGAKEFSKDFNKDPLKKIGDVTESIAKVGIEDPLFIPSLLYAPSKVEATGVKTDAISKIANPIIKESKAITSDVVKATGAKKLIPDIVTKDVNTLRAEKINKGLAEQNTRNKTVGKSFNENTIIRKAEDGSTSSVTPIDTFAKYDISPNVEKGTINMGDYKTGAGELGKIKNQVATLDETIENTLKDTGLKVPTDRYQAEIVKRITENESLKRQGKVQSTIDNLNRRFEDYKRSYGDTIDIEEVNKIRKEANKDFNLETQDTSRLVGDVSRDLVYNSTDDKVVKSLLQQQGELLAAKAYAESLNGTKVIGGRLGNYVLRTTGALIGSTLPNLPIVGPLLGAVGGEYAARALQQTQFKSPLTEAKALLQRSNKKEVTSKANIIPKTTISSKTSTFEPKSATGKVLKTMADSNKGFVRLSEGQKITPELKDSITSALKKVDTDPMTITQKVKQKLDGSPTPDLEDADMMFRLDELKSKAKSFKDFTNDELIEAQGLLDQIGVDVTKELPTIKKPTFKQNSTTGKLEGSIPATQSKLIQEAKKYKSADSFVSNAFNSEYGGKADLSYWVNKMPEDVVKDLQAQAIKYKKSNPNMSEALVTRKVLEDIWNKANGKANKK